MILPDRFAPRPFGKTVRFSAVILKEGELRKDSVIKNYLTTANDGKKYEVTFYSLEMIMAIGFRVRSKRGTQFRIWANQHLTEYLV